MRELLKDVFTNLLSDVIAFVAGALLTRLTFLKKPNLSVLPTLEAFIA